MGLETPRIPSFFLLSLVLSSSLLAAPKLRLSTATVGPVSIATNSNGTAQTVEAYNIGDGALSLSVAGSANWLVPGLGAARVCTTTTGTCIPIQIGLQTAALAAGIYTGTVTVSDANAVDAPQTITVTVQMGGGVPDRVELVVPPGGAGKFPFATNSQVSPSVSTQNGRPWLSLALEGGGSFSFVYSYAVTGTGREGMGDGTYDGSITLSGSTFAPDNKRIAVTMRVTSQPIAQVAPQRLGVRIAQNVPKQTKYLVLSNGGLGTLAISNVAVAITGGGTWLTAGSPIGLLVPLTFDTANLATGKYQATVVVATNAANGNLGVPVDLEVVA